MNKIKRNDKCPCNSGKKFKKCCIDKIASLKPNLDDIQLEQIKKHLKEAHNKDWMDISNKITIHNYPNYHNQAHKEDKVIIVKKNNKNKSMFDKFILYNSASDDSKYFFQYKKSTIVSRFISNKLVNKLFLEFDYCDICKIKLHSDKIICDCMDIFCPRCFYKGVQTKQSCSNCGKKFASL